MAASISIWDHRATWEQPENLYALMQKHRDGLMDRVEENTYAAQLMCVVYMQFQQHRLADKLQQVRADIEGVIQDSVQHLLRKSRKGFYLKAEGWKPMMTTMNTAVYRFVLTEILKARRLHQREAASTDYYSDHGAGEDPGMDSGIGQGPIRAIEELSAAIDGAEDMIVGDIICTGEEFERLEAVIRLVRRQILYQRTPLPHSALPAELKEVPRELHALIVSRILRVIRDFAGA